MWQWFKRLFRPKTLADYVAENHKTVKVKGVLFHIRKITPYDWANGSNAAINRIATWTEKRTIAKLAEQKTNDMTKTLKEIEGHMEAVIMAGVVKPKLSLDDKGANISVKEVMRDAEMANQVYRAIVDFTFQKKNFLSFTFQKSA